MKTRTTPDGLTIHATAEAGDCVLASEHNYRLSEWRAMHAKATALAGLWVKMSKIIPATSPNNCARVLQLDQCARELRSALRLPPAL